MTKKEQREICEIGLNSVIQITNEYLKASKIDGWADADSISDSYSEATCNLAYGIVETMSSMSELNEYLKDKSSDFKFFIEDWVDTMRTGCNYKEYSKILNKLGLL